MFGYFRGVFKEDVHSLSVGMADFKYISYLL